jgi:hypothetical protein
MTDPHPEPPVRVSGALGEQDAAWVMWLGLRPRRGLAIAGAVILALGSFAAVRQAIEFFAGSDDRLDLAPAVAVLALAAYVPLFVWTARRRFRELPGDRFDVQIDASGYRAVSATGRADLPWTHFTHWREGRRGFLLRLRGGVCLTVPKRLVEPGGVDRLRGVLRAHLPER